MKLNDQSGIRSNGTFSAGITKGSNLKSVSIPAHRLVDKVEIGGAVGSMILDATQCGLGDPKACGKLAGKVYLASRPHVQKAELESIKKDPYMQYMLTEKDERKRAEAALRNNLPIPPRPQSDTASNVVKGALIGGLCGLISGGPLGLIAGAITGAIGGGTTASVDIN